jgi:PEGA domain
VSMHWANVYVDGERVGRVPMKPLTLPAGEHVLELRDNPQVKDHRQKIVIRAGKTLTLSVPAKRVP